MKAPRSLRVNVLVGAGLISLVLACGGGQQRVRRRESARRPVQLLPRRLHRGWVLRAVGLDPQRQQLRQPGLHQALLRRPEQHLPDGLPL